MTWAETLAALTRLERLGIRLGLDNVRAVCRELGHPERAYRVVHVAGTNGKGTTAATIAALARAHGIRAGLATSPHLVDIRERIVIDGRAVGRDEAAAAWGRLAPFVDRHGMTYFEATTLLAFEAFAQAGVELAAVEVGMGGRLDATNVVSPDLAIVTGVARDHERELGSELASIAREKAGIFKPGVPALVGDVRPAEVGAALAEVAGRVGAPLVRLDDEIRWSVRAVDPGLTRFDYASDGPSGNAATETRLDDLAIPLTGEHFAAGAALGLRAWERLAAGGAAPALEEAAVRAGLAAFPLGGRGEWREAAGAPHLFDVAHNPAGCERLAATCRAIGRGPAALVFGALADKAWPSMLDALRPAASRTWICDLATAGDRRLTRSAAMPEILQRGAAWAASVAEGLAAAQGAVRGGEAGFVLVAGSFHTVGEALVALGLAADGEPYAPRGSGAGLAVAR